jgi:hypothetical protein
MVVVAQARHRAPLTVVGLKGIFEEEALEINIRHTVPAWPGTTDPRVRLSLVIFTACSEAIFRRVC